MRILRYALVSAFFITAGVFWSREIPKLKVWLVNQIERLSLKEAEVQVKIGSLDFHLFPPGVELKDVKIQALNAPSIPPTHVDAFRAFLNITSFLGGRFEIEKIYVDHPSVGVIFKGGLPNQSSQGGSSKRRSEIWDQIMSVPIKSVDINHAEILAVSEPLDMIFETHDFSLKVEKDYRAARLEIFIPNLKVSYRKEPNKTVDVGFMTRIIADPTALEVSALKIGMDKNYVIARGLARGDLPRFQFPLINGKMIANFNISEATQKLNFFLPNFKVPPVLGDLHLEVTAQAERGHDTIVSSLVDAKDIKYSKFFIGNLNGNIDYAKDLVRSKNFQLTNNAGKLHLEDLIFHTTQEQKISTKIVLDNIELRTFLHNLDIGPPPAHMDMQAAVPCEGTLNPLLIHCAGDALGTNFRVFSQDDAHPVPPEQAKTVVALHEFKATAEMNVDKNHIWFPKSLISIGHSQGTAIGEVSFKDGFNFSYHSDRLDFQDIQSLAGLRYIGAVNITGTTKGDGHQGVIDAQIQSPQMWFEEYGLGAVQMHLHYQEGLINFGDIKATQGKMTYNGQLQVRVSDSNGAPMGITSGHIEMPFLDLADLQKAFAKKVTLPFQASGQGAASIEVSGPFSLSQLNYTLKSNARRVTAAGETFDELRFNVHGVNGHAFADDIAMKKGNATLLWKGDVQSSGTMHVDITGHDLRLADFDHIHLIPARVDGHFDTEINLRDFILSPKVFLKGQISEMTLNQQTLEDSEFYMQFSPLSMKLNGQFFNDKIHISLLYPLTEGRPLSLKYEANAWDFSSLLGFLSKTPRRDYETSLTAKGDFESPTGDFWHTSGKSVLNRFYVRHGTSQMSNSNIFVATFDDGLMTLNQSQIEGDNTQLTFGGVKTRKDNLNFNINGRVDLSLLTFLTPFLRDMSGELSLSTQIAGTRDKPDLLGSAFIKKGYFRLDALNQPFEDISTDMLFSQSRVLINRLTGHLAGGDIAATGTVTFNDLTDITVEITGDLLHTSLTIPDGLDTRGDLHFGITGSWFPYIMRADYVIDNGAFTKNFGDTGDSSLKRSIYLPKVILQKDFVPLEVDVSTHFQKGIQVRNSMMDATVRGDLRIKGDPSHPVLTGDVRADAQGKVFFRDTPFTITETRAKFDNPTENNPTLYTLGSTRVRDWDVTLLLQGSMQKPNIELTSSPPLPQKSIISLLALGITEDDELKSQQALILPNNPTTLNTAQSQSQVQSYEAGTVLLSQNPLQNEVKKRFGVNVRFTQTVDETRNIILPRVIAEKEWTPRVTTSVSRSMGSLVTQDATVEYKLDRHFSFLGSYEERDFDEYAIPGSITTTNTTRDILGLDLQFQVEFK